MIIITGASGGLGRQLLDYFVNKGEDVIGIYNRTIPTAHLQNCIQLDLEDEEAVEQFIQKGDLRNIVLINAVGITISGMAHKQSLAEFKKTIDVNLLSVYSIISKCLLIMRRQNYGRIINFSSVVPKIGTPGNVAYAASKAALWGMSKVIAMENATKGITSNCLNLGYCNAGMVNTIPINILDDILNKIPQRSLCSLDNIINAIEFLIKSDYVTGTELDINGGMI